MNGPFNAPPRPVKPVRAISRCVYSARLPFSPRPVPLENTRKHREQRRESLLRDTETRVREKPVGGWKFEQKLSAAPVLDSSRQERGTLSKEVLVSARVKERREGSQVLPANLPVPRQDNGGSCLGGFRGRECLTVLTRERERGVVSAPRRDVDRLVERQISWERMGDDRCTFGILSVRNLTIFEKEKKKRYFLSIWQNENIFYGGTKL